MSKADYNSNGRTKKKNAVANEYPTWSPSDTHAANQAAKNFALRLSILDFANKTSLVGPPFIIGSTNWLTRSIWIILFVAGIGMTIYNVTENSLTYFSWPIQTELSLDHSRLPFPMVTFCNVNPIKRRHVKDLPEDFKEFLEALNPEGLKRNESVSIAKKPKPPPRQRPTPTVPVGRKKRFVDKDQLALNNNKTYIPDKYNKHEESELGGSETVRNQIQESFKFIYASLNDTEREAVGHRMDDMLLSCSFETRECDASNFKLVQSSVYGNCYSFNADGDKKAKRRGQQYGLTLTMYLELDEYIMGLTSGYGLRVSLDNQNTLPFPETDGVYVSAAYETDIGLRMINVTRLGKPYGSCETNDKFKKDYGVDYTRTFCQSSCQHRHIQNNCSCFDQSNRRYYPKSITDSLPACETDAELTCMSLVKAKDLRDVLGCACPSPCTEKTYDTEISARLWPTPEYLNSLVDAVCKGNLKRKDVKNCNRLINSNEIYKLRNFMQLNIFYRDLNFQVVTETAGYPWYTYLSNLGGSVGLYLGLSVLGLFEIVHLLILLMHLSIKKLKNANKRPPPPADSIPMTTSNM